MPQIQKQAIEYFLREENIKYKDKKAKGDFYICSPFDFSDADFKCSVSYSKNGAFNCFKTHQHGNFFKFVKLVKKFRSFEETKIWLFKQSWFLNSVLDFKNFDNIENTEDEKEDNLSLKIPEYFERFEKKKHTQYYDYLKRRNIREDVIDKLEMYVNPLYMHRRIVFTVYENGKLIFYTGRTIDDKAISLRWYSQSLENTNPVFFLNQESSTYFIFEGLFDCLRIDGGVCTFGASISEYKIVKILDKEPSKIVVVMDGDKAGIASQIKLCNEFSKYHDEVYFFDWTSLNRSSDQKDFSSFDESFFRMQQYNNYIKKWDKNSSLKYKLNISSEKIF